MWVYRPRDLHTKCIQGHTPGFFPCTFSPCTFSPSNNRARSFHHLNRESIFQSPFMACAGFLLQPFCYLSAGSRGFFEALFRHLALFLPVRPTEEGLGPPRRVPGLLSCIGFVTLHVFNLFSHSAFDLVSRDYTVRLPREGTVTSPLPPCSCWSGARLLMGALLMEK